MPRRTLGQTRQDGLRGGGHRTSEPPARVAQTRQSTSVDSRRDSPVVSERTVADSADDEELLADVDSGSADDTVPASGLAALGG